MNVKLVVNDVVEMMDFCSCKLIIIHAIGWEHKVKLGQKHKEN